MAAPLLGAGTSCNERPAATPMVITWPVMGCSQFHICSGATATMVHRTKENRICCAISSSCMLHSCQAMEWRPKSEADQNLALPER
jgi:hypothetical protein